MKDYIEPNLASGFRDYLPSDAAAREWMVEAIKKTFRRFGFASLETPGVEREEILTGGDPNFKKQIFKLTLGGQDEKTALRFDLTVPLARVMAAYQNELPKPFRRYQIGNVWRGERAQAGRFREFMQFDADIVGAPGVGADAEIISLMYETLSALGLKKFSIRVNNRKILNNLSDCAGFPKNKTENVLRIIDKLDKEGWKGVEKELISEGLKKESLRVVKQLIELKGESGKVLKEAEKKFGDFKEVLSGVKELEDLAKNIKALGVPDKNWLIDFSVARGLGYYTGPVFEAILLDYPEIGSVASGGRYDNLISRFSSNNVSAVGFSVGVDRLFTAMKKLNLMPKIVAANVLILNFDEKAEITGEKIATELRRKGIATEIYLGEEKMLKGQLAYAVKNEYPFVLIIGSDEISKGVVQVKNMKERTQESIPMEDIFNYLETFLKV
ncbi:MAG: histidine--tRNA ligase [Minisyncoccia bacterium]